MGFEYKEKDFLGCVKEGNNEILDLFLLAGMSPDVEERTV